MINDGENIKIAILVIAYNRVTCVERLLDWLNKADYDGDSVDLIISIDYSGSDDVLNVANSYEWRFGNKKINAYSKKMGLKKHILDCGNFLNEYDALIVFEDDIVMSPSFYLYSKACINKYKDDDRIAGISLYSRMWNFEANLPFEPSKDKNDVFFIQMAESWGQIWLQKQWKAFRDWLDKNTNLKINSADIPQNIRNWPDTSSWLKFHIIYVIKNNKYFVYPYVALSSNCSEIGEHNNLQSNQWQVPMIWEIKKDYLLPDFDDSTIKYDAFFERINSHYCAEQESGEIAFDLYGTKTEYNTRYLLSSRRLNYKVINKYGLALKPHENNFYQDINGDDLFLYDLLFPAANSVENLKKNQFNHLYYFRFVVGIRFLIKLLICLATDKIKIFKKK